MINPMQERLRAGRPALGFMVTVPSPAFVQVLARSGADWLMLDMEHGPIDIATCQAMIAATAGTECAPIVRVGAVDPTLVKPVLDAGAYGVVFPMVKTGAEAQLAVESVRYPPQGIRGIAPLYAASRWGVSMEEYIRHANNHVLTIALIEHVEAVRNLDDILVTEGLDVAHIAPYDLSASMGLPGELDHPDVAAAVAEAEKKILASGKVLGGLGRSAEQTNALIARGYRNFVVTHDHALIATGVNAFLDGVKR